MSTTDILRTALAELAALRESDRLVNDALKAARAVFDVAHAPLIASKSEHAAKVAEAEAQVRALTLVVFDADKTNKKPIDGVVVKVGTTYAYDVAKVREWALSVREQVPGLVETVVNQKVLDALITAKAVPGVTATEEPTATIAKDLSPYLVIPEPTRVN